MPLEFFRGWWNGQRCGEIQNILPVEVLSIVDVCSMGGQVALLDIVHYGQGLLETQNMGGLAGTDHILFTDIFLITLGVHAFV